MKPDTYIDILVFIVLAFLLAFVSTSCSSISGTRTDTQGNQLKISSTRWFWASDGIDATTKDANGFEFGLKVAKSHPDAESIKASFDGAGNLVGKIGAAVLAINGTNSSPRTGTNKVQLIEFK